MASLLYKTFLSPTDEFIADSQTRSLFDAKKHRKYNAQNYYQSGTMEPMEPMDDEPKRSDVGRAAYKAYVEALRKIQQLEPVSPEHTGESAQDKDSTAPQEKAQEVGALVSLTSQNNDEEKKAKKAAADAKKAKLSRRGREAAWERLIEERKHATSAYRFQERLKARVDAFGKQDENTLARIGKPPIRPATYRFLVAKPEADYTTASMVSAAVMILLYSNTLFQQANGISKTEDGPLIYNSWIEMSKLDTLWAVFLYAPRPRLAGLHWHCPSRTATSIKFVALYNEATRRVKELFFCSVPMFYIIGWVLVGGIGLVLSPLVAGFYYGKVKGDARQERSFKMLLELSIYPAIQAQIELIASLALNLSTSWRIICIGKQLAEKKLNRSAKDFSFTLTTISNLMYDLTLVMLISDNNKNTSGVVSSLVISLFLLMKNITAQLLLLEEICDGLADLNENRLTKFEFALLISKLSEALLDDDIQYNYVEHLYSGQHIPLDPDVDSLTHKNEDDEEISFLIPDIPEDLAKEFGHDGMDFYDEKEYKGDAKHYTQVSKATRQGSYPLKN